MLIAVTSKARGCQLDEGVSSTTFASEEISLGGY